MVRDEAAVPQLFVMAYVTDEVPADNAAALPDPSMLSTDVFPDVQRPPVEETVKVTALPGQVKEGPKTGATAGTPFTVIIFCE